MTDKKNTPKPNATVKKVIKLTTGELIFGSMTGVENDHGHIDVLIKMPYQAKDGNIIPYDIQHLGNAPGGIQINPMHIVWSSPLEDFQEIEHAYFKATTNIELPEEKPRIII